MEKPAWGAVFAVALGVAGLSTGEMLPASLLTPMATDLRITEGLAGQMVTATAVVGLVTSLVIAAAARNLDRRVLLLVLASLQVISNLLVAFAPTLPLLVLGRLLLGVAVGGFWSFSASVAMRLVPEARVPRAFSIIFGGAAIASVAAAPIATSLGAIVGWRNVFLMVAALAMIAFVWQFATLPPMPARGRTQLATIVHLLQRPPVQIGMLGVILSFAGNAAFSTYLRPFLEAVTHVNVRELSGILLGIGIASFVGTSLAGAMIERNLRLTIALMSLLMSVLSVGLMVFGSVLLVTSVVVILWGFAASTIPVGWSTWLTRTVPDEAESGGGLLVAAIQLAITLGAAAGGIVFDQRGAVGAVAVSGIVLLLCALVTTFGLRARWNIPESRTASKHTA